MALRNSDRRDSPRPAYTLLEAILAMALSTVVLGLVAIAIHVHLGAADKSRRQVEEAQLARVLLQRIAEDLRNAVPYVSNAATTATTASTALTTSGTTTASTTSGTSTAAAASSTTAALLCGGLYGSLQCIQMDTSRRLQSGRVLAPLVDENMQPIPAGDVKTVTYSLGSPGTEIATSQSDRAAAVGLYRRELERAECSWAMRQGLSDVLGMATELLADEVTAVQFTYYDGTTAYDVWDSSEQKKLPSAVRVALMIRRPAAKQQADVAEPQSLVYDMLVDLPNAQAEASSSQSGGSQASSSASSSSGGSQTPTN